MEDNLWKLLITMSSFCTDCVLVLPLKLNYLGRKLTFVGLSVIVGDVVGGGGSL